MTETNFADDPEQTETELARLERRWIELLSELRVAQTGTQILTGFLLSLVLQPLFQDITSGEKILYLGLVVLAVLATVLAITPVSFHRALFGRPGAKASIVASTHFILRLTLVVISLVLAGTVAFVFSIALNQTAGIIAGVIALIVIGIAWVVTPYRALRGLLR
ncbi:MAG: hypothetical protein JJE28_05965 [Actinomycetales bacterium]|nr:hypothetical protein [Actinomycetales bacterium]